MEDLQLLSPTLFRYPLYLVGAKGASNDFYERLACQQRFACVDSNPTLLTVLTVYGFSAKGINVLIPQAAD